MRAGRWVTFAIMVVAVAAFARYLLARQESAALRAEIALLQQENGTLARLRTEHEQLRAGKVSDAELERLRNDRAALARLRAEIRALEESAERKESRAQETALRSPPPRVLDVAIASNGGFLIDGSPADQNALRQLLTDFARRSEQVLVRLHLDPNEKRTELIKQTMEGLAQLGKEVGVKFTLRVETGQPRKAY